MVCTIIPKTDPLRDHNAVTQHYEGCRDYTITFSYGTDLGSFSFVPCSGTFYYEKEINEFMTGKLDVFRLDGLYIDQKFRIYSDMNGGERFYYQSNKEDVFSMFEQMKRYIDDDKARINKM